MSFPKQTKIPVAEYRTSNHDLSSQHVTTADFMQFNVAKAIELVPNQSIEIKHQVFSRLEPLPVPTFGRAKIYNRCYFVPYRTIMNGWNDFITDTPHTYDNGDYKIITNVPCVYSSDFVDAFISGGQDYVTVLDDDATAFDFIYRSYLGTSQENVKYKFTALGRYVYKLLRSLGYNFTFSSRNSRVVSCLPLLAACRVYMDYYYPSQYTNDVDGAWLISLFQDNTNRDDEPTFLLVPDLVRIFGIIQKVCYSSDYFVSAWDNPSAPSSGLASSFSIKDQTMFTQSSQTNRNVRPNEVATGDYSADNQSTTPVIQDANGDEAIYSISKYILTALGSLSDYLKRHQLAGSKVIDRYLARFGVKLRDEQLMRSVKVGEFVQDLQFGDVTSTSDTEGANLGSYAGKGISYGQGDFKFSTTEYGMLIIISTIVPDTQYYEGENRMTTHVSKLDFYTPEFDALGVQALSCNEVYTPIDGTELLNQSSYEDRIFGFVPRYSEYKVPYSQITGDYLLRSMNTGKEAWTLFRSVKPFVDKVGLGSFRHDIDFVFGLDSAQYNRIFYNTEDTADHFNIIHDFNIKSTFPGKSLFETYEFENEHDSGKVTIPVGGSQDN